MITKMTNYEEEGVAECGMNTAEMLWWIEDVIERQTN